jgi:hypothetical protein
MFKIGKSTKNENIGKLFPLRLKNSLKRLMEKIDFLELEKTHYPFQELRKIPLFFGFSSIYGSFEFLQFFIQS